MTNKTFGGYRQQFADWESANREVRLVTAIQFLLGWRQHLRSQPRPGEAARHGAGALIVR